MLLACCAVLTMVAGAQAQTLHLGLKAGINQGTLTDAPELGKSNVTTALNGGAFGRFTYKGFCAQAEVLWSQRRGVFSHDSGQTVTYTLSYIDVPLLLGYQNGAFRLYAGPSLLLLVGASQRADAKVRDKYFSQSNYNSTGLGLQAGIGVDLGNITLDFRYDGALSNLGKEITTDMGVKRDYSTRHNMFQFSLGYRIFNHEY